MKKSIKSWFPIKNIENGIIELKNGRFCKMLEIYPVNFLLKSVSEQESILYQYKNLLNVCNFDIQILLQSRRGNLDEHIEKIEKNMENESFEMKEIMKQYVEMIKKETLKSAVKKQFFIVVSSNEREYDRAIIDLQEKSLKLKSSIVKCGNSFKEFDKSNNELIDVIYTFLNPITSEHQKFKEFNYECKKE